MNELLNMNPLINLFDDELNPFEKIPGVRAFCTSGNTGEVMDVDKSKRGEILSKAYGFSDEKPFFVLSQKHTDSVFVLPEAGALPETPPVADAVITKRRGVMIAVRTADCVPILLASKNGEWIGAVHSGWRGTKARLLEKTIGELIRVGVPAEELTVWIGPRISGQNYEVSVELASEFEQDLSDFTGFRKGRTIDLGSLNAQMALKMGIAPNQIHLSAFCTYANKQLFPSYRRDGYCKSNIYSALTLEQHPEKS